LVNGALAEQIFTYRPANQADVLFLFGSTRTQPVSGKRAPKVTLFVPFGLILLQKTP
jgi:hypothetical protein